MLAFDSIRRQCLIVGCALTLLSTQAVAAPATRVTLETSAGNITLELDADKAPKTVANFLKYVEDKHYDGTIFHRVISNFMIQGGGLTPDMKEKPARAAIQNEANNGLKNSRGTIAMARKPDPHSATAQFFINVVDNDSLDFKSESSQGWGYCVFGQVVEGMDVVDKIREARTGNVGPYQNVPNPPIIIKSARIVAAKKDSTKK